TITYFSTNSVYVVVNYSVTQNTSSAARTGKLFVGGQSFTVVQLGGPMTLAEALDTVGTPLAWNTWSYSSVGQWTGQSSLTHDGVDAAQSGTIIDNGCSNLQTGVNGPGTLSFWWKVSSETNYDALRFYVNGVELARISGEVDWQQRTVTLPAGVQ